jgi:hypothetical protein
MDGLNDCKSRGNHGFELFLPENIKVSDDFSHHTN